MSERKWHGLTHAQVLATWDHQPWRTELTTALVRIAVCRWMPYADRTTALQLLNQGLCAGVLPGSMDYPGFAGRILRTLALGVDKSPWWRRWSIRHRREQLDACARLIHSASQFVPQEATVFETDSALGRLLS